MFRKISYIQNTTRSEQRRRFKLFPFIFFQIEFDQVRKSSRIGATALQTLWIQTVSKSGIYTWHIQVVSSEFVTLKSLVLELLLACTSSFLPHHRVQDMTVHVLTSLTCGFCFLKDGKKTESKQKLLWHPDIEHWVTVLSPLLWKEATKL